MTLLNRLLFVIVLTGFSCLFAQVNIEKFRQDQEKIGFAGKFGVDFSFKSGNSNVTQIGANGRLNYNGGVFYSFLVFKGDYGRNNGREFSNDALLHWRTVCSVGEQVQAEAFAQIDYNKARLLLFRDLLGGGLRLKLYKSDGLKTRWGVGGFGEQERYNLPSDAVHPQRLTTVRASTYVSNEITLTGYVTLTSIIYYQPALRTLRDYRILSENIFAVDLGKYIDLNITVDLRHDNVPPDGKKLTDVNSRCGVAVKF